MGLLKKKQRKIVKKLATMTVEKVHYFFCLMLVLGTVMYVTIDNATIKAEATTTSTSTSTTSVEDKLSDYSFYALASATAAAFSSDLANTDIGPEEAMKTYFKTLNPATGGGIIAYCDGDSKGLKGMFMNILSISASSKSYASLDGKSFKSTWTSSNESPFAYYVSLGASLADLGIDSTGSEASTIGLFSERMITGSVIEIVFLLSQSVVLVFGIAVTFLKVLNPFTFFQSCTVPGSTNFQNILQGIATRNGTTTGISSFIQTSIATFISSFYSYLYAAGWALLIVAFVIMVIKVCFPMAFGKKGNLGIIKTWFTKALFLIGGIAILGVTYTDVLNWLEDQTHSGNGAAEKVIASTFCDFENWTYAGMPLTDIEIDTLYSDGAITASATNNVQELCYQINSNWNSSLPVSTLDNTYSGDDGSGAANVKSIVTEVQNNTNDHGGVNSDSDAFSWVLSTLDRYKTGNKITSSAYESAWKNVYWSFTTSEQSSTLESYFNAYGTASAINQANNTSEFRYSGNNIGFGSCTFFMANPFGAGGDTISTEYGIYAFDTDDIPKASYNANNIFDFANLRKTRTSDTTVDYNGTVLSAMSIYNYLNTTFEASELKVYSSTKSSSNYIRDFHYSVSLVGKGSSSAIILIMCISLLLCYTVLGFAYGFGIIFTNVKRGLRLIIAVPGAMLGSLQAIAKVVSYTVLMILEIVINIFLYCLTTEMLYALAIDFTQLIETYTATALGTVIVAVVQPLISIVIIIALWWFTIKCIQLRKPIIKSAEEAADNVISKFIVGADRGGSPRVSTNGTAAAAGAGAGAGAGAAGKAKPAGSVGDALLHPGKQSKARREAKKAKGEAKANMLLGQMGLAGGTSSAVQEEQALNSYQKAEKENKKQARKNKANGAVKMAVGAAETAAGAATGNAALAARGAANMGQGALDVQNASINATNNSAALANQAAQSIGGRGSAKAAEASSNNVGIAKFDAVNEAKGAATAAIGGVDGLAAAGGSGSGVASAMSNAKSLAGAYKATGGDTAALAKAVSSGDYAGAAKVVAGNQGVKTLANGGSMDVGTSSRSTSTSMSHTKSSSLQTVDSEVTQIAGKATVNRATGNGSATASVSGSNSISNTSTHGVTATQTVTDTLNVQQQTVTTHQSIGLRNNGGTRSGPQASMSGNNYTQTVNDSYNVNHNANVNESYATTGASSNGGYGYRPSSGTTRHYEVTDSVNVSRNQRVNYQNSSASVSGNTNGNGYFSASGTSKNYEVTDNVNVTRRQRTNYQEFNEGNAPKHPNKS